MELDSNIFTSHYRKAVNLAKSYPLTIKLTISVAHKLREGCEAISYDSRFIFLLTNNKIDINFTLHEPHFSI